MSGDHDPTPPLNDFLAAFDQDDNEWWRIACGHHLNLFEEAVERMRATQAKVDRVTAVCDWLADRDDRGSEYANGQSAAYEIAEARLRAALRWVAP